MIKVIIIDKTFRHLGLSVRDEIECENIEIAFEKRDKILKMAREYGAVVKVVIQR